MKTDRRQQLRTNELARSLTDLIEFLRRNSGAVFVAAVAVVLVGGLGAYWYSARVSAYYQGWDDFYGSQSAGSQAPDARLAAMRAVADKYKSDPALCSLAWLKFADASVQEATSGTRSIEDVQRLFTEALGAYNTILSHYSDQTLAKAGARFGLAYLAENRRQWDQALAQYQAVVDDPRLAEMPYKESAAQAIKRVATIRQPVVFAPPTSMPATPEASGPATGPIVRPATKPFSMVPAPRPATQGVRKDSPSPSTRTTGR